MLDSVCFSLNSFEMFGHDQQSAVTVLFGFVFVALLKNKNGNIIPHAL